MKPREHFDRELQQLSDSIMLMASRVEEELSIVLAAYERLDPTLASVVSDLDRQVNKMRFEIEERCILLIAKQQPTARDLRLIIASLNMIVDLERMGDQAMNISYNVGHYRADGEVTMQLNLPSMAVLVKNMVREALDAFMKDDVVLAEKVLQSDDAVDQFKNNVFNKMVEYMKSHPDRIESALDMILIARNLERMADHATNIAEDVIFACTGEDVRHGVGKAAREAQEKPN